MDFEMAFKNESFIDFGKDKNRQAMRAALNHVKNELGKEYSLIIDGKKVSAPQTFFSLNPAKKEQKIGIFHEADESLTEKAIERAESAFESWKSTPIARRIQCLDRMAELMKKKRFELTAWIILEIGKSWGEADGEVAEAIDFLKYYAQEMFRFSRSPRLVPMKNEKNEMRYIPLGIGAIITPWNFPLAILAGMTSSAIVTGNTVVVKPSEYASAVAHQFMKIAAEAGVPAGVIHLLTGRGPLVGKYLVRHPKIRFVSFTGSKKVGVEISEVAAKVPPSQKWIKRVMAEMGGKDAIVVDKECHIKDAVKAVIRSAFGYSGQKCSACSRVIVDESIYESFVNQLVKETKALRIGAPEDPQIDIGPVVSDAQLRKAAQYIEIGKTEGKLLTGGRLDTRQGYFVEPTIFGDVAPNARLAQEEVFAPVLALIRSKNFDEAIAIANNTEYGLTGAVYTKNPQKIKKAREEFFVGNLYINRGCTGAFVGAHPFGGFNMSGTDSKAGGPDYLLQFMQAKTISERK